MRAPKILENIGTLATRLDQRTLSSADQMGLHAAFVYGIGLKVSVTKEICSCEVATAPFHSGIVTGRQNEREIISLWKTAESVVVERRQVLSKTSSLSEFKQLLHYCSN